MGPIVAIVPCASVSTLWDPDIMIICCCIPKAFRAYEKSQNVPNAPIDNNLKFPFNYTTTIRPCRDF